MKNRLLHGLLAVVSLFCIEDCVGIYNVAPPPKPGTLASFVASVGMNPDDVQGWLQGCSQASDRHLTEAYSWLRLNIMFVPYDMINVSKIIERSKKRDIQDIEIGAHEKETLDRLSFAYPKVLQLQKDEDSELARWLQNSADEEEAARDRRVQEDRNLAFAMSLEAVDEQRQVDSAREHAIKAELTRLEVPPEMHPAAITVMENAPGVSETDIAAYLAAHSGISSEGLCEHFLNLQ